MLDHEYNDKYHNTIDSEVTVIRYRCYVINTRFFFFFKQKTAYEISACLVGSEMCIRDRGTTRVSNPFSITGQMGILTF